MSGGGGGCFISNAVSSVGNFIGGAVQSVGHAIDSTVNSIVHNPLQAVADVAAVATGNAELIPLINGGMTYAKTGNVASALESGALSYAMGQAIPIAGAAASSAGDAISGAVGDVLGSGTELAQGVNGTGTGLTSGAVDQALQSNVGSPVSDAVTNAANNISNLPQNAANAITNVPQNISNSLDNLPQNLANAAGKQLAGSVVSRSIGNEISSLNPAKNSCTAFANQVGGALLSKVAMNQGNQILNSKKGGQVKHYAYGGGVCCCAAVKETQALMNAGLTSMNSGSTGSGGALPSAAQESYLPGAAVYGASDILGNLSKGKGVPAENLIASYEIAQAQNTSPYSSLAQTIFSPASSARPSPNMPVAAQGGSQRDIIKRFQDQNDSAHAQSIMNEGLGMMGAPHYGAMGTSEYISSPAMRKPTPFRNGGQEHNPEFVTGVTGNYVKGKGDGQSDDIPAMLADGEYVFDADTVAALGNGSSDAGAKLLDHFRESLREHKRAAPADKIPPKSSPLVYMKEALKRHSKG